MKIKVIDKVIDEQTEPFQKKIRSKHKKMKFRLIGKGKNKKKEKRWTPPAFERAKSSPPIGEEVKKCLNEMKYYGYHDFQLKETLNSKFWEEDLTLKKEVSDRLKQIAQEFFKKLKFDWVDILNITLTGSSANYNWTEHSDLDLHIIIDFKQVDENASLVKQFLDSKRIEWNRKHEILIRGHEIEIYIQDLAEPHASTGVYSITDQRWMRKPTKKHVKIDEKGVHDKAGFISSLIDGLDNLFFQGKLEQVYNFSERLKEKIQKFRKSGLEKAGEYSNENLAFKVLRRTGYLKKLSELHTRSYDEMMSIENGEQENEQKIDLSAYHPVF